MISSILASLSSQLKRLLAIDGNFRDLLLKKFICIINLMTLVLNSSFFFVLFRFVFTIILLLILNCIHFSITLFKKYRMYNLFLFAFWNNWYFYIHLRVPYWYVFFNTASSLCWLSRPCTFFLNHFFVPITLIW